ncbi:MAG: hypothetical protein JKY65_22885 [Planctomycetes bacterium]|nr:hypothetical protein [Planctomycetota bacterium]
MQQDPLEIGTQPETHEFFEAEPYPVPVRKKDRERGATLMFALAILALLVLFSTVFARLMSIERRASAYYRDRVRSKLAARAGIERAIVELRAVAGQNHYSDPYAGGWKYYSDETARPPSLPTTQPVDLLTTSYPSFRQQHTDPTVQRWGETLTYSGYLGQPDDTSHLVYRLKIIDSGSQLNLNNPDQRTANRMLKNLLFATFLDANDNGGVVAGDPDLDLTLAQAAQIADVVIPLMDGTSTPIEVVEARFRSKPQLGAAIIEAAVGIGLDRILVDGEWIQHLRDKVTVYSWEDPDVIRPYRLNVGDGAMARRSLTLMARAPVNLNTATAPVLYALFAELAAHNRYGTFEIKTETAVALAAAIIARRADPVAGGSSTGFNPFKSWPEFEAWLDDPAQDGIFTDAETLMAPSTMQSPWTGTGAGLPPELVWPGGRNWAPSGGLIELLQNNAKIGHRDLIKSMLNPNTMLNKYGALPTHGGYLRRYAKIVDKSDILRMTTEGCFDSLGVFEITSTGLIVSRDLRDANRGHMVSAGHTDLVVVRVYTPFRLTTQSQFEKHRANMIQGNFIESPEKLFKEGSTVVNYDINDAFRASVNIAAYFDDSVPNTDPNHMAPGWPGMVSWPQYSLKRVNSSVGGTGTARYPLYDTANPATWDGHLTLSNMITVRTGDNDFVVGFARGKLEAFKVRAWWEPKDVDPSGAYKTSSPTRPAPGGVELAYLANSLTRGDQAPARTDSSGQETVLAEQFTDTGVTDDVAVRMFTEGSQLVNTGVMLGPDRLSAAGTPRFLAYDSNNIDLRQGTSIRFWVQPLIDPYAEQREVLFYFNGSNGSRTGGGTTPNNRSADPDFSGWPIPAGYHSNGATTETEPRHGNDQQAGFIVYKQSNVITGKVEIRLEDLGITQNGMDYTWDRSGIGMAIDVTPTYMTGSPLNKPDPAQPEWIPGSWHWIVINFGPGLISGASTRQAFASLQVDKRTPAVHGIRLFQRGDNLGFEVGDASELGEVQAYADEHDISSISDFVSAVHQGNSNDGFTYWRILPRMLGDYYHCTQYDPNSAQAGQAQNGAAIYGTGTIAYRRTKEYGEFGSAPAMKYVGSPWYWYDWVVSGTPGWYEQGAGWPSGPPFPALATNRSIDLEFYDSSGGRIAVNPAVPFVFRSGGWEATWPSAKVDTTPSPFGSENSGDYGGAPNPQNVTAPSINKTAYPGGPKEWHMSAIVAWDEVHYTGRNGWAAVRYPGSSGTSWLPGDLSTMDMVDHPPAHLPTPTAGSLYEPRGGRFPYSVSSSARQNKNTALTTDPNNPTNPLPQLVQAPYASYVRGRQAMNFGFGNVPIDAVDDDCHGCEDCDVDGPVLFGAEPAGTSNYTGNRLAEPNLLTMATAVFDNIVFLNQDPDRRTDFPGISSGGDLLTGGAVSLVGKDFEDRFYEEDLAQFLDSVSGAGAKGTGAVFHRGLLELRNRRFRLASMTWTSYPTRVTNLDFEVALWKIDNVVDASGNPTYAYGNVSLINGQRDNPDLGDFGSTTKFAKDPEKGAVFGNPSFAVRKLAFLTNFFQPDEALTAGDLLYVNRSPYVDGLGSATAGIPPELLILGVRLQGYTNTHIVDPANSTADDQNTNPNPDDVGVLVSPVLETPIFEDVTLNLTFPRPQYLYAEEGAIE